MFVIVKKKAVIAVVLCLTVMSVALTACFTAGASVSPSFDKVIVLDAGHGGVDGGVVGSSGIKESELNLKIVKELEKELKRMNYGVVLTRTGDEALAGGKKADMQARKKVIDEANADMVVSIHINKFSDARRRGVQVFYDDTKRWTAQGMYMQNVMNEFVNKKYAKRDNLSALGGDYFIVKCSNVPSIIIECGFISNSEDQKLLTSREYREYLAKYIAIGIDSLLSDGSR